MSTDPKLASDDLGQIQKLISAGDLPSALEQLEALPRDARNTADILYMSAVCYRHMGNLQQAEDFLQQLLSVAPEFSRGHQELGHLRKGQGRARDALAAPLASPRRNVETDGERATRGSLRSSPSNSAVRQVPGSRGPGQLVPLGEGGGARGDAP